MYKLDIRQSGTNEINDLLEIFNSSRLAIGCYSDKGIKLDEFSSIISGEDIHVAVDGEGIILGFIGVWVPDQFIHHLYVSPDQQRKGIAKLLLIECIEIYQLPLTLKCDNRNTDAIRFYENCGFLPVSEGIGDYGPWTEYVLKNELRNA